MDLIPAILIFFNQFLTKYTMQHKTNQKYYNMLNLTSSYQIIFNILYIDAVCI
jgi:hypothetical protein